MYKLTLFTLFFPFYIFFHFYYSNVFFKIYKTSIHVKSIGSRYLMTIESQKNRTQNLIWYRDCLTFYLSDEIVLEETGLYCLAQHIPFFFFFSFDLFWSLVQQLFRRLKMSTYFLFLPSCYKNVI